MFRRAALLVLLLPVLAWAPNVKTPINFYNMTADPTSIYPTGKSAIDFTGSGHPKIGLFLHARTWQTRINDVRFSVSGTKLPQSSAAEAMTAVWSADNVGTSDANGSHQYARAYNVYQGGTHIDAGQAYGGFTGYWTMDLQYTPIDTVVAAALLDLDGAGGGATYQAVQITSRSSTALTALSGACSYIVLSGGNNGQSNGELNGTATTSATFCVGFYANDSSTQWSLSYGAEDNQGTTDTYRQFNKGQVAVVWDAATFESACDTAWIGDSAGTRYVYYTDNVSGGDWALYIIGFPDPGTNPEAGWTTMRTSTGTQTVTTAAQPCNLIVGSAMATAGGSQDGGLGMLGMGTYYNTGMAAKEASLSWVDGHGLDVSNSWTYLDSLNIMTASDDTDGTMEVVAHMEAFNATSFQLDYTAAPGSAYDFGWIYFGGTGDTLVAAAARKQLWFFPD